MNRLIISLFLFAGNTRVCAIISHNDYYNQDKTNGNDLLLIVLIVIYYRIELN